jgi:CheY-like chemotaxis protein
MPHAKPLLLVEDDLADAMAIKRALADLGAVEEIVHTSGAEQALAHLRSPANERPALILLDLNMPGMSGIDFLRTVKGDPSLAGIPVVVLTTSQERCDIAGSFDLNAAGYIVKPSDYAAIVEALKIVENYWSLNHLPTCHN